MTPIEAKAHITRIANELGEHFDAVQIVISWPDNGGTRFQGAGFGNFYARRDMCREFVESAGQKDLAQEIAKALPQEPPDDSEAWKGEPT